MDLIADYKDAAGISGRPAICAAVISMSYTDVTSESCLVYDIIQELDRHEAVFHINAGSIRLPSGKVFHGLPKGFSDILFIRPDGIACFVEAKIHPNKPTPEQTAFIERMQGHGCRAGVAYTEEDAVRICGMVSW